jgi:hypothetical protein
LAAAFLFVAASAAVGAISGAGPVSAQPQAANPNNFNLSAEGDGMWIEVDDNSLPLTSSVSASPYSAEAAVNSIDESTALAGVPYLGSFISSLPGLVDGLGSGQIPSVPPAPGYVQTSYPTQNTADESNGPYILTANSSQYSSSAEAGFGVSANNTGQPQVSASAIATANSDGSVTVTASAGSDFLNVGPIDIGDVTSTETMTEQGSQAPTLSGTTDLGTATVAGIKVGFDQNGLEVLGDTLPLLGSLTALSNVVDSALSAAGITVQTLPSITTDVPGTNTIESYTSGGLEVQQSSNVPTQGKVTVSYILGRVTLIATDTTVPSVPTSSVVGSTPTTTSGITPAASQTGTGSTGTGSPATVPTSSGPSETSPVTPATGTPATTPTSPDLAAPTATPSSPTPQAVGQPTRTAATGPSADSFYLVLVAAALAALGGSQVLRLLGVRLHLNQRSIGPSRRLSV